MNTTNAPRAERFGIIGTGIVVFEAYEPSEDPFTARAHSTLALDRSIEMPGWWGHVGTAPLPAHVNAIPVGPERSAACRAFWDAEYERAYGAILATFPEAAQGKRSDGRIEIVTPR